MGDLVLSRDDATGQVAYKPVVALIPGEAREIWDVVVRIQAADGSVFDEVIHTTEEHPFRTADGQWLKASDLQTGVELVTAHGVAVVVSAVKTDRVKSTFNFEVTDFHAYFVGEMAIYVHNSCADKTITGLFKQLQKHHNKLDEFRTNSTVHPAMKRMSKEAIQAQQMRRTELLQGQIWGFQNEIVKRMQIW